MEKLMKLELKKILSKKDVMLMITALIIVPAIFSLCIVHKVGGLDFNGQVSIDDYGIMVWSFLKYLFVLYLVPIHIACSFVGREIENRSINIMLANETRRKVILSKILIYAIVVTVFFVLFQVSSLISFVLFVKGTEFATVITAPVFEIVFLYLFQWLEMVFVLLMTTLFCCVIKGNAALLLSLGVVIIQKALINSEAIRRILPAYISDYGSYGMIESNKLVNTNLVSLAIYGVIIAVLVFGSFRIWKRRDF